MPVRWSRLLQFYSEDQKPPIFSGIASEVLPRSKIRLESDSTGYFLRRLKQTDPGNRYKLLFDHISDQVIKTLGLTNSVGLNADQELTELGMDSLMAVEISNRLKRSFNCSLSSTVAFEYSTLNRLTDFILLEVLKNESHQGENNMRAEAVSLLNRIDELSDDQVDELLRKISAEDGENNLG